MGVHPAPLAIYRSVRRRATRDRMLWVRADVAEQPRRLLDAARDEGARAGGSRLLLFLLFFFLVGGRVVSIDTARSESEKGKKIR